MIKFKDVAKYYKTKTGVTEGIRNINVKFSLNEFVAITGESGSGKTTLLNVLSGFDSYEDGEILINGNETSHFTVKDWEMFRAANVGFVFQNYNIIESYTVYQNIIKMQKIKTKWFQTIEITILKYLEEKEEWAKNNNINVDVYEVELIDLFANDNISEIKSILEEYIK